MTEAFECAVSTNPLGFERSEPTSRGVLDQIRLTTGCARVVVTKTQKDHKTGETKKEEKSIARIRYSFFGGWGQQWIANTSDIPTGAQDVALSCTAPGELPVLMYATYRAYANVPTAGLEALAATDIGLYEILIEGRRKVYFDVDGKDETAKGGPNKAQKLRDDYQKVKEIILSYFPGARLQISGSDVPLKYSLHIVLSNYYADSVAETEVLKRFSLKFKEEYGFDEGVYTKNRYMKAINQSKRERDGAGRLKPPRIQSYIEGNDDIKKHFIMAFFDDDAMNINGLKSLQEDFKNTRAVGGSNGARVSVLDIPQFDMACPETFDFYTATPIEKLWQIPPERLVHDVTWKIMLCCRSIGVGFEDFWGWARRYKDDSERQRKYTSAWNSTKGYTVSEIRFCYAFTPA